MFTAEQLRQAENYQNLFIDAFADILAKGLTIEFEDYINNFRIITRSVWKLRNLSISPYPLEKYQQNVRKLISACVSSNNVNSKLLGLKLIATIYEEIGTAVHSDGILETKASKLPCETVNNEKMDKLKHSHTIDDVPIQPNPKKHITFNIFSAEDFFSLIRTLNMNTLKETVVLPNVLYYMLLVDMALFYDQPITNEVWLANHTVKDIHAFLGRYIAQRTKREDRSEDDLAYWTLEFGLWYKTLDKIIAPNLKPIFANEFSTCLSLYTCGLVYADCCDIAEEGMFKKLILARPYLGKAGIKIFVATHAFIYYMIERENKRFIGKEQQASVRNFWDKNVKKYQSFIEYNYKDIADQLIENLNSCWHYYEDNGKENKKFDFQSQWLHYLLRRFDFGLNSNIDGIPLVLEEALNDFCVYTIAYINKTVLRIPWTWVNDKKHNIIDYLKYINKVNENKIRNDIYKYFFFMSIKFDKTIDKVFLQSGADRLYKQITTEISNLYKDKIIKEAKNYEIEYEKNKKKYEQGKNAWEKRLIYAIKESFKEVIVFDEMPINYYLTLDYRLEKLAIYSMDTYSLKNEDIYIDSLINTALAKLIDAFIIILINSNYIKRLSRNTIGNQEYINELKKQKTGLMLGSEYLLNNNDYKLSEKFREVTNDYKHVTNFGCNYGAIIKYESAKFFIKDIKIDIHQGNIDSQREVKFSNEFLEYEPVMGISLRFTKTELEKYLCDGIKTIIVTARIAVDVKTDSNSIGFYFTDVAPDNNTD